jgi:hypothetical protein
MAAQGGDGVSLGIAFKGPEGIVLAADSRVTLTAQLQQPNQPPVLLPSTYDNATKLLRIRGQDYVGAVTYGIGAIGEKEPRTAHSYIPELEQELIAEAPGRLGVEDFAARLSRFFLGKWQAHNMPTNPGQDMVFLVGGYDAGAAYGRVFELFIPSRPDPVERHSGAGEFGLVWGGQREYADRLVQGFDSRVPQLAKDFLGLDDAKRDGLLGHLKNELQAPVPFAFLPLQDCVDLAIFLIRTTITMQHWIVGVRGVGGAIDVAVITEPEGFAEIQRKKIIGEEVWP